MTTLRQAAELALDAIKDFDYDKRMAAIEAVEQALADPEQEPVAWMIEHENGVRLVSYKSPIEFEPYYVHLWTPFYTAPQQRQWVGLTDDEIKQCLGLYLDFDFNFDWVELAPNEFLAGIRAIEAHLKEKNT